MNQHRIAHLALWVSTTVFLLLALLFSSCVSSEEAGSSKKNGAPVTTQPISDSVRAKVDAFARTDSLRVKRGGFTSQHDTLVASVVRKSKSGQRVVKPIERPDNPAYTVQIGAYARTDHALNAQKLAKDRFAELPIFNYFEPFDKLYRVRVGKFDLRRQADSLRKAMGKQFPNEYSDSWINYISR
jgi:cell division septation protein DedD